MAESIRRGTAPENVLIKAILKEDSKVVLLFWLKSSKPRLLYEGDTQLAISEVDVEITVRITYHLTFEGV